MARTQSGQWPLKLICAALTACFTQAAVAMPNAPAVVNGSATFSQTGNALTITNTDRAIINWNTFSIGSNESVRFIQPSASSSVMNRVLAADPSLLLGSLQSNGKVFLFNPAGITVGAGARIDVAGFIASTMTLSNEDFLANRLNFVAAPGAGSVKVEQGAEITTASGGQVYLIAPQVENSGLITTPQGEIILAAGQRVELIDTGTPGVKVSVVAGNEQVLNMGQLMAESGRIGMVGAVVRQQGTVSADSLVREGGRIFLKATQSAELAAGSVTSANGTQGGTVQVASDDMTLVSGTVSATGSSGSGGRIELLGDKVGVFSGAVVDASGETGGGTILVGGDFQGKNPDIRNASISYLARDASLRANAGSTGDGGKIIVWADDTTRAYGSISARGGNAGGDGGFVEVSGKQSLTFDASVDTQAPAGKTGTLLLDPFSVTIKNAGSTPIGGAIWTESGGASELSWSSIDTQLMSTDVTIQTTDSGGLGDDIFFMPGTPGPIVASATATKKLTLIADDDIAFSTALTLKGALTATAGGNIQFSDTVTTDGNFTATAGGYIDLMRYKAISYGDMSFTAGTDITVLPAGGFGDAGLFMNKAGGSQILTAGGNITLAGGSNPTPNGAYIYSAGSQSITSTGSLSLTGGTGTGDNRAEIRAVGNQTIDAGSISLSAGSGSTNTSAKLTAGGNQYIQTNSGGITVTGNNNSLYNEAVIESDTYQYIDIAGNLQLTGGGNGSAPAGGAMLTAPSQHIIVNGNLSMQAGNSNTTGDYGMGAPAVIGWDNGANIYLDISGALSMNGVNATNQSVIGAAVGSATVQIQANAITTTANTSLGNWDGTMGGSVELTATSGAISLPANSNLRSGSLAANAGSSISMLGNNYVDNVDLIANGTVTYHTANANTTHIEAIDATGNIVVTGDAGSTSIALGNLTTIGASSISVNAQGQLLDDNGSGTANLSTGTGNITLNSLVGTPTAGTLAISSDIATSGQVTAGINGGPYGSISIRDVGSSAVAIANINASAATSEGAVEYFRYGDVTLGTGTALTMTPKTGFKTSIGASGNMVIDNTLTLGAGGSPVSLSAGGNMDLQSGTVTISGDALIVAGNTLSVSGGNFSLQGSGSTVIAGGLLDIAAGKTITAGMGTLDVMAGSINIAGTLSGYGDTYVYTPGSLTINGGSMLSTFGNLDFIANGPMNVIGSVSAAQGIIGDALGGLTLGAAAGGSGTINAAGGVVDLAIGGTGIEMYNSSYINSTDANQAAGGLIKLMFPGLAAGGSMINGVATFDGGYKVGGTLTTLGSGLEVTYGILSNPVSDAIVAAMNSTSGSGGGTSETSGSLALAGATSGTSTTTTSIDGTQTVGGTEGTFGGTETTSTETSTTTGSTQETQNAKKKPAQCSA